MSIWKYCVSITDKFGDRLTVGKTIQGTLLLEINKENSLEQENICLGGYSFSTLHEVESMICILEMMKEDLNE